MSSLSLTAAPANEPLLVEDLMRHARVDSGEDHFLLETSLVAARQEVETYTGMALMTQTWTWKLDGFPVDDHLVLPRNPVASITSVQYVDSAGATQTMSSGNYRLIAPDDPVGGQSRLALAYGASWPSARDDYDAVIVTFVAGYADRKSVPPPILAAILLLATDLYEFRETQVVAASIQETGTVGRLLAPYRRHWVA